MQSYETENIPQEFVIESSLKSSSEKYKLFPGNGLSNYRPRNSDGRYTRPKSISELMSELKEKGTSQINIKINNPINEKPFFIENMSVNIDSNGSFSLSAKTESHKIVPINRSFDELIPSNEYFIPLKAIIKAIGYDLKDICVKDISLSGPSLSVGAGIIGQTGAEVSANLAGLEITLIHKNRESPEVTEITAGLHAGFRFGCMMKNVTTQGGKPGIQKENSLALGAWSLSIRTILDHPGLLFPKNPSPESDKQIIQKIKNTIDTDLPLEGKLQIIDEQFAMHSDPSSLQCHPDLVNRLEQLESESLTKCLADYAVLVSGKVGTINTYLAAFHDKNILRSLPDDSLTYSLSLANTALGVFSHFYPDKAYKFVQCARGINHLVDATTNIVQGVATLGGAFLFSTAGSLAAGNFIAGIMGIIGIANHLFSKNKGGENSALSRAIQGLFNAIASLHEDMIAGFQMISNKLDIIEDDMRKGFFELKIQLDNQTSELHHRFDVIERILQINQDYLYQIKKLLERNERYHLQLQSNSVDLLDTLKEVNLGLDLYQTNNLNKKVYFDCAFFTNATEKKNVISDEYFKKYFLKLMKTFFGVRRVTQASSQQFRIYNEQEKGMIVFSANHFLSDKQISDPIDYYELCAEQNIHLLIELLLLQNFNNPNFKGRLFSLKKDIVNPEMLNHFSEIFVKLLNLIDISRVETSVIENLSSNLGMVSQSITSHENFINILRKENILGELIDSYLNKLNDFIEAVDKYIKKAVLDQYLTNGSTYLQQQLEKSVHLFNDLPTRFIPDLAPVDYLPNELFKERKWHWWGDKGRWSGGNWEFVNQERKQEYIKEQQVSVSEKQRMVKTYCLTTKEKVGNIMQRKAEFEKAIEEFFIDDDFRKLGLIWKALPYYFINTDEGPLVLSDWHKSKIPDSVFELMAAGHGKIKLEWEYEHTNERLHTNAYWLPKSKAEDINNSILLYSYEIHVFSFGLNQEGQKLLPKEIAYYLWFGGKKIIGAEEFDYKLGIKAEAYDVDAYKKHSSMGTAQNRRIVYKPTTEDVPALFPDKNSLCQLPEESKTWLDKWTLVSKISEEEIKKIEDDLRDVKKCIRRRIFSNLVVLLESGYTDLDTLDNSANQVNSRELFPMFNQLNLTSKLIKLVFSLLTKKEELHSLLELVPLRFDTLLGVPLRFDALFLDRDTILEEIKSYAGDHVSIKNSLKLNYELVSVIKDKLQAYISSSETPIGLFSEFKNILGQIEERLAVNIYTAKL